MLRRDQETVCLVVFKNNNNKKKKVYACPNVFVCLKLVRLVNKHKLLGKLHALGCELDSTFMQYSMAAWLQFLYTYTYIYLKKNIQKKMFKHPSIGDPCLCCSELWY